VRIIKTQKRRKRRTRMISKKKVIMKVKFQKTDQEKIIIIGIKISQYKICNILLELLEKAN
jgi:hypothetical protein